MGSILKNMIAQQLKSNGFGLNYFDGKKTEEIDFVVQNGMGIDLPEAKSGFGTFAIQTGAMKVGALVAVNVVGTVAAYAMERAIIRAVQTAESAYGLMGYHEIHNERSY